MNPDDDRHGSGAQQRDRASVNLNLVAMMRNRRALGIRSVTVADAGARKPARPASPCTLAPTNATSARPTWPTSQRC